MYGTNSIDVWWALFGIVVFVGVLVMNKMAAHDAKKQQQ